MLLAQEDVTFKHSWFGLEEEGDQRPRVGCPCGQGSATESIPQMVLNAPPRIY